MNILQSNVEYLSNKISSNNDRISNDNNLNYEQESISQGIHIYDCIYTITRK